MAVMNVEVFALQPTAKDTPLSADEQFTVDLCFTTALAALNDHTSPDLRVISCDVIPYATGALIQLLTLAPSADHVTDAVAQRLHTAMANDGALFAGWELAAGNVAVWSSDN